MKDASPPLEELLSGIVKIGGPYRRHPGLGFMIGPRHVLTCTHVLNPDEPVQKPNGRFELTFPFSPDRPGCAATILEYGWHPEFDIAILEMEEATGPDAGFARSAFVGPRAIWRHPFVTFGYPQHADFGLYVDGLIQGPLDNHWVQLEDVENVGRFVEQGFSGGPVWDPVLQAIVGMVVAVDAQPSNRLAYMIPIPFIAKIWPDLLGHQYRNLKDSWNVSIEERYGIREGGVRSPLTAGWEHWFRLQPWHERVTGHIARMAASAQAFRGLDELKSLARQIDLRADYEDILKGVLRLVRRYETGGFKKQVEKQVAELEALVGMRAEDLRKAKRRELTPEESRLLKRDAFKHHMVLLRELASNPNFDKCMLVMGGMGSGKTHFIHQAVSESRQAQPTIVLPVTRRGPVQSLSELVLENLRRASGVCWPDLAAFDLFLSYYDKFGSGSTPYGWTYQDDPEFDGLGEALVGEERNLEAEPDEEGEFSLTSEAGPGSRFFDGDTFTGRFRYQTRLVLAFDDLARWALDYPDFLPELIDLIARSTHLHRVYWVLTIPNTYYVDLIRHTGPYREFWTRYGIEVYKEEYTYRKRLLRKAQTWPNLERWIVLDKLNEIYETGLGIVEDRLAEKFGEVDLAVQHNESAAKYLCNPLVAWAWLEMDDTNLPSGLLSAVNLNFIQFISSFWQKHFSYLVSHERNRGGAEPFSEKQLRYLVILITRSLMQMRPEQIEAGALSARVVQLSGDKLGLGDPRRAQLCLDLLKQGLILQERQDADPLAEPEECLELRFDSFWGYFFAQELSGSRAGSPGQFEAAFQQVVPRIVPDALEFFLLLADTHSRAEALRYFDWTLASSKLPAASTWMAGAKASPEVQQAMAERALRSSGRVFDAYALFAFLYFMSEIPLEMARLEQRFSTFHRLFPQIKRLNLADYFLYITERLLEHIRYPGELVGILQHFTGSEKLGIAKELALLSADTLLNALAEQRQAGPDADETLSHVIDYLTLVKDQYGPRSEWESFREWFLHFVLRYLAGVEGVALYTTLQERGWYHHPTLKYNAQIKLQMERQANIALGSLYGRRKHTREFEAFIDGLADSPRLEDRRNAVHIIRHSVPIGEDDARSIQVDEALQPVLRRLLTDPDYDLSDLFRIPKYLQFFRDNLDDFDGLFPRLGGNGKRRRG